MHVISVLQRDLAAAPATLFVFKEKQQWLKLKVKKNGSLFNFEIFLKNVFRLL